MRVYGIECMEARWGHHLSWAVIFYLILLRGDLHWTRARLVTSQPERSSVPTALSVWICSHWWLLCGAGNQNSCLQDKCFYSLHHLLEILISFSTTNHRDPDISILITMHVVFSFFEELPQCQRMSPARALVKCHILILGEVYQTDTLISPAYYSILLTKHLQNIIPCTPCCFCWRLLASSWGLWAIQLCFCLSRWM